MSSIPTSPRNFDRESLIRHIHIKLRTCGLPSPVTPGDDLPELTRSLIRSHHELRRILHDHRCPVDTRCQAFLDRYLADVTAAHPELAPSLPTESLILDREGLARELSLPPERASYENEYVRSYRLKQGVLQNPTRDRRTTKGVFHVAEGGLPIPNDKKAVPKQTFAALLKRALDPPKSIMQLPFTADQENPAETFVSLMLRPVICPAAPGLTGHKSMEIRFFVPGGLVSNLDFVESIFGNAGDPTLRANDAALDVAHWSGHSGCVILAPHLQRTPKEGLGLPHISKATEKQKRDGMYWEKKGELYNDGSPFKLTCRDESGVVITLIADNYYGYCKKEVKTQISYAANLFGLAEEEHAGGALAFPSYSLGDVFLPHERLLNEKGHRFADVVSHLGDRIDVRPEGYAVDKNHPDILYMPADTRISVPERTVSWTHGGKRQSLRLLPGQHYVHPSGYHIHMEKHTGAPSWRLVGTQPEGTFCHKPCTVSGGGKSEISKPLTDALLYGPFFVADYQADLDRLEAIMQRDYGDRFRDKSRKKAGASRPILSPERTLGSVIKLLTTSESEYTDEYNAWLNDIPHYIKALVFIIKRFHQPEWGDNWRQHFSVSTIDGHPGHEMMYKQRKLVAQFLRLGYDNDGAWRTFKLRQDFMPAQKIQREDDISVSAVVPADAVNDCNPEYDFPSLKFIRNCERYLFQRPDDAVHPGQDKQAELDLCTPGSFVSNYEPLTQADIQDVRDDFHVFERFTEPLREFIEDAATSTVDEHYILPTHPRIVDGKPTLNPRYLQYRPDLLAPKTSYLADVAARLYRRIPPDREVHWPVNAVVPGRRNNPPDPQAGIRSLAVFNPLHYQELPELFIDFICSVTGKSPSTTGAGSEGALTKGPFNALCAVTDLNNALVSFILTGFPAFTTAAGYVGPKIRVDHDISLLLPELWCRMSPEDRDPKRLIEQGCLEKMDDFEHNGKTVLASRLGYRMTTEFLRLYFGKVFDNPSSVFNERMLRPEIQDMDGFVDGIDNIVTAQRQAAQAYFDDGSIEGACPPLRVLLEIMVNGVSNGMTIDDPKIRGMFDRDALLASDWYQERLKICQQRHVALYQRHVESVKAALTDNLEEGDDEHAELQTRLAYAEQELATVSSDDYLAQLQGTIGADPLFKG